jgi:hypothetical protein
MLAIFLFLFLLALASIISNLPHAALFLRFVSAPTFIALGFFLSSKGLGLITPQTLKSLDLFVVSGLSWIGFLLGLRRLAFLRARPFRKTLKLSWQVFATYILSLFLCTIFLYLIPWGIYKNNFLMWASFCIFCATILMGRTLLIVKSPMRINSFHAGLVSTAGLLLLTAIWRLEFFKHPGDALIPIGLSLIIAGLSALVLFLVFSSVKLSSNSLVLFLISTTVLLAGASLWLGIPIILMSYFFGFFLSTYKSDVSALSQNLFKSEQSLRIVLVIFFGAYLNFSIPPLMWGFLLGVILSLIRYYLHRLLKPKKGGKIFYFFMGSSEIAVPFSISLWFVFPQQQDLLANLVAFLLAASSAGDILGVIRWWRMGKKRKIKIESPLINEGSQP